MLALTTLPSRGMSAGGCHTCSNGVPGGLCTELVTVALTEDRSWEGSSSGPSSARVVV